MIELKNVTKMYPNGANPYHALKGISFSVKQSEMLAVLGPSGSGKTTMMNILGLLDRPSTGTYQLNGMKLADLSIHQLAHLRNRTIGFVFQSFCLLERLNAWKNVALPLHYRPNIPRQEKYERARECLSKVGMDRFALHKPAALSGGQQQRVAIARALVGEPQLILADEPTGALDAQTSEDIMAVFSHLNQKEGRTIIMITHNQHIAAQFPRTLLIYDGNIVSDLPY